MALVDLKSNLANFRTDFKPMDLETRFANPNSSTINIDSIPEPVSKKSKLAYENGSEYLSKSIDRLNSVNKSCRFDISKFLK